MSWAMASGGVYTYYKKVHRVDEEERQGAAQGSRFREVSPPADEKRGAVDRSSLWHAALEQGRPGGRLTPRKCSSSPADQVTGRDRLHAGQHQASRKTGNRRNARAAGSPASPEPALHLHEAQIRGAGNGSRAERRRAATPIRGGGRAASKMIRAGRTCGIRHGHGGAFGYCGRGFADALMSAGSARPSSSCTLYKTAVRQLDSNALISLVSPSGVCREGLDRTPEKNPRPLRGAGARTSTLRRVSRDRFTLQDGPASLDCVFEEKWPGLCSKANRVKAAPMA